ncbi:hypothetical protein GCM10010967_33740 [Dyadobacter beijingensis]|uniref:Uncharacterized protein n=1 Tax=Dyadobacter beijingensis TaxID=365489 RepID=A0ABQ2I2P5_9BACT|nr:hypothetical protein GCM10010967_33740 [Dyadobacter beijingensis]
MIIVPPTSSVIPGARNFKVFAWLHPLMIFDRKILNQITFILNEPARERINAR